MLRITTILILIGLSVCNPLEERIVGGTTADFGEFPFMASLRKGSGHVCGSTIISEDYLLTAAHCVHKSSPSSITIQYGVRDIKSNDQNIAKVEKIIVHEDYKNKKSKNNDIAIIKLKSPLEFNANVSAVVLPLSSTDVPEGSTATVIGWGLQKTGGTVQKKLQKVDLITFSNKECSSKHSETIYSTNICAGVPRGGKGQCNGDSGGPLIFDNTQIGIVSWSKKPCGIAPYPGVYIKVSKYIKWINRKSGLQFE